MDNPNDMLFPLMVLGDYVRAGIRIPSTNPVIKVLTKSLSNKKLIDLYINETDCRMRKLIADFNKTREKQPAFTEVLPRYCRLHSAVHGLQEWHRRQPTPQTVLNSPAMLQLLQLDLQTLETFGEYGLCREEAEEILILAGRGLVNIGMESFFVLRIVDNVRTIIQSQNEYIYIPDLSAYAVK